MWVNTYTPGSQEEQEGQRQHQRKKGAPQETIDSETKNHNQ